jgi:hypothetical protein
MNCHSIYDHTQILNQMRKLIRSEDKLQPLCDRAMAEKIAVPEYVIQYLRKITDTPSGRSRRYIYQWEQIRENEYREQNERASAKRKSDAQKTKKRAKAK